MKFAAGLMLVLTLGACATPPPPEPPAPTTLSDAEFQPMLVAAVASNKLAEWEPAVAALLARTDLTDAQRARVFRSADQSWRVREKWDGGYATMRRGGH